MNSRSDGLAERGFEAMTRGDYDEGIALWQRAAGAEHIELHGSYEPHASHVVFFHAKRAAASDPAAAALVGLNEEHEGDRQRTTGKSPNYVSGGRFVNHYGQAILWFRMAADGGNSCARDRLAALEMKIGRIQFREAEEEDLRMRRNMRANLEHAQRVLRGEAPQAEWPVDLFSDPPPKARPRSKPTSGGGGCYIATAVYGSYDAPQVMRLRAFRDDRLASTSVGRGVIRAYYWASPKAAQQFRQGTRLNVVARGVLDRVVRRLDGGRWIGRARTGSAHVREEL